MHLDHSYRLAEIYAPSISEMLIGDKGFDTRINHEVGGGGHGWNIYVRPKVRYKRRVSRIQIYIYVYEAFRNLFTFGCHQHDYINREGISIIPAQLLDPVGG